ncbi:MAG: hypothetical protein WBA57_10670 [Elainellaceae cyanobacterium]
MKKPWRYWRWVRLTLDGRRQVQELLPCREWMQSQGLGSESEELLEEKGDRPIQIQLMQSLSSHPQPAEGCLRCFISHAIDRTCRDLFDRFGRKAGMTKVEELLVFVLTDADPLRQRPTTPVLEDDPSLAGKVLRSFNPTKAQLNTWTKRLVISDRPLNQYLQEHGVYLDSDWSLLNALTPTKLRRLLLEQANISDAELERAIAILRSYHEIYRRDRLAIRFNTSAQLTTEDDSDVSINRSRCEDPTLDQLKRMVEFLRSESIHEVEPDKVLEQLATWAQMIRQQRNPPTVSLDDPQGQQAIAQLSSDEAESLAEQEAEAQRQQFMQRYRKALLETLDEAIALVLDQRVADLSRRKPIKAAYFLDGLYRFICNGEPMGTIAPHVGLKRQYEVSRLLNLRALRADIRREVEIRLRQRIRDLAEDYVDVTQLDDLLEQLLDLQLKHLVADAEAESFTPHAPTRSLLHHRLSDILTHRRTRNE